ncbi:hypothetical protein GCM10011297_07160 [Bacterioplanes sanyensis]|nr:hypothetical protein GCM10011297_07160 [Bacterioplanes sanyensis]
MAMRLSMLCLTLLATTSWANQDNYYSDDLFEAIEAARQYTHHYDYSQPYRYNRTTSLSIELPRLLNQEMAQKYVMTPDQVDLQGNPKNTHALPADKANTNTTPAQSSSVATSVSQPVSVRVSTR